MKVKKITAKEAKKVTHKNATVLVSTANLEENKLINSEFKKRKFIECHPLLDEAHTIAKVTDDFFDNQLRVFTEEQKDPLNFQNKGILNTILYKNKK